MEEVARTRRAARDAVRDVTPEALHDEIDSILVEGEMSPGALTLSCAQRVGDALDSDAVDDRAAGVQLIYDGLRLTRELVHAEPWTDPDERSDGDLQVLAADVMVARGFYLLAHTNAADAAVETVRAFGRSQTRQRNRDVDAAQLEADVLELAVVAGTTAAGETPAEPLRERAASLGRALGEPLPPAERLLAELREANPAAVDPPADDHVSAPDD